MINEHIGARIAARRKELGMTQRELAERLHITDRAVSRWERGKGAPDVSLLMPLAKALDTSVDELLGERASSMEESPLPKRLGIPFFYYRAYRFTGWIGVGIWIGSMIVCTAIPGWLFLTLHLLGAVCVLGALWVVFPLLYRCPNCGRFLIGFRIKTDATQYCHNCGKALFSDRSVSTLKEYRLYRNKRENS